MGQSMLVRSISGGSLSQDDLEHVEKNVKHYYGSYRCRFRADYSTGGSEDAIRPSPESIPATIPLSSPSPVPPYALPKKCHKSNNILILFINAPVWKAAALPLSYTREAFVS